MKKLGLLIFAIALVGSLTLVWGVTGKSVFSSFDFLSSVKGSGNVIIEKRDLANFKNVSAGGAMRLEITIGKEFLIELEGDDNILPTIKTEVRGDTLYFERKRVRTSSRNLVIARIQMPELTGLDISGASDAIVNNVKSESLKIDASGSSRLELSGETRNLSVDVSGASKLTAENLKTERSTIEASGASKVVVFASEAIDADASGASKIIYRGNPKTVNKNASGASSIVAE